MVGLLLSVAAGATPLWVSPELDEPARTAVVDLWPQGPLEIREGSPEPGSEGLKWDGQQLVMFRGDHTWVGQAPDAATAVLLARTWLREGSALSSALTGKHA